MEVGQLVQLRDVIPVGVCKPARARVVHLTLPIQDLEGAAGKEADGQASREERLLLMQHKERTAPALKGRLVTLAWPLPPGRSLHPINAYGHSAEY